MEYFMFFDSLYFWIFLPIFALSAFVQNKLKSIDLSNLNLHEIEVMDRRNEL